MVIQQTAQRVGVGINSFSIAYSSSATTANSCYLNESSNNNLECWGAPVNGAIGNGYVIYPAIMPDGLKVLVRYQLILVLTLCDSWQWHERG